MTIYKESILKVGLDPKKVQSIANRISRAAKEASEMGIVIFGGSGGGDLRIDDNPKNTQNRHLILATLDETCWDGGDGAQWEDTDGFLRGE